MEIDKTLYDYKTDSIEQAFSRFLPDVDYRDVCINSVSATSLRAYRITQINSSTDLRSSGYIQFNRLENEKLVPTAYNTTTSAITIGGGNSQTGYCVNIEDLQPVYSGFWFPLASIFCCVFIFYCAYKLILSRIWRRK